MWTFRVVAQMSKSAKKDDSIKVAGLLQYFISYLHLEVFSVVYRIRDCTANFWNILEKDFEDSKFNAALYPTLFFLELALALFPKDNFLEVLSKYSYIHENGQVKK